MSPYEIIGRAEVQCLKKKLDVAIENNRNDIKDIQKEIDLILELVDQFGHDKFFQLVASESLADAKNIVSDGQKLVKATELLKIFK